MKIKAEKIIAIVFLLIGLGFFSFSIKSYIDDKRFVKNSKEVTGEIVDIRVNSDRTSYIPVVKYFVNGRSYEYLSGTLGINYKIGDEVNLIYDQNNPEKVRREGLLNVDNQFIFAAIFGFVFTFVSIYLFVTGNKRKTKVGIIFTQTLLPIVGVSLSIILGSLFLSPFITSTLTLKENLAHSGNLAVFGAFFLILGVWGLIENIYKIIRMLLGKENIIPPTLKEKKHNYFSHCYLPGNNHVEGVFVLLITYVVLLAMLMPFIFGNITGKLTSVVPVSIAAYIIIYDIVKKIKNKYVEQRK